MPSDEVYPWELWHQNHQNNWLQPSRNKQSEKHVNRRRLKYAAGAAAGILVVDFIKRKIGKVPIIGPVLGPIVGMFVPTIVAGTLLGAAAVYGYEKGDPLAARELVPVAEQKLAEATTYVKDTLHKAIDQIAAPLDDMHRDLDRLQAQRDAPLLRAPQDNAGLEGSYEDLVGAVERITKDLLGNPEFPSR